ncbi:MAG: hypothetical protein LBV34_08030 [Nocardiopsaceae bacterium]|nr:hypothetical protein [Nocardiopsaceae bacterium]
MPETSQERANALGAALREIVAEYGRDALSNPAAMSNLVKDLLPDDQQIARILVVAAEQRIPEALLDHVSQGMDVSTAVRLAASSFAESTLFAQQACSFVVSELAIALGLGSVSELGRGPVAIESEMTQGTLQSADTALTVQAGQPAPSSTLPRQPKAGGTGSPELPVAQPLAAPAQLQGDRGAADDFERQKSGHGAKALYPARRKRSLLLIAVFAILALSAGAIVLLNQQSYNNPRTSPSAPQGKHVLNRQIANNGSLTVNLTTITVRQNVMTVDVVYHNTTSTTQALACAGYTDPSIVTVQLANGTVLHAQTTYCSDNPDALFAVGPGDVHRSYATFTLTGTFPQPFSFDWPYGALAGSVDGLRI